MEKKEGKSGDRARKRKKGLSASESSENTMSASGIGEMVCKI